MYIPSTGDTFLSHAHIPQPFTTPGIRNVTTIHLPMLLTYIILFAFIFYFLHLFIDIIDEETFETFERCCPFRIRVT